MNRTTEENPMTEAPRDVWCSKCPEPATRELLVTDGSRTYTASYCVKHAWLVIAPRGGKR